jgi:L-rhamnose mutarotase
MFHSAFVMQITEGSLDAYRKAHQELWPEVAKGLRENHIDMAIYHHEGSLFVFVTAPSEKEWLRNRQDPGLAAWNAKMANFLRTDAQGGILFSTPEQVFGFGSFALTMS